MQSDVAVLLDEATSALDNISQQRVLETIFTLSALQTVIIIAHRLSTVVNCDRIYFMENGKIVANGTHAQLIKIAMSIKLYTMKK